MRTTYIFLVVAATLYVCFDTAFALSGEKSKVKNANVALSEDEGPLELSRLRYLRNYPGTDTTDVSNEDRAIDIKRLWDWKYFTGKNVYKMLRNKHFRFGMFKKWDRYPVDRLRLRIGQAKLSDSRIAEMFLEYLQRYRKYKTFPKVDSFKLD